MINTMGGFTDLPDGWDDDENDGNQDDD